MAEGTQGLITSVDTDDSQVVLIVAAHNAALSLMGDAPTAVPLRERYAEAFERIYPRLKAAVTGNTPPPEAD